MRASMRGSANPNSENPNMIRSKKRLAELAAINQAAGAANPFMFDKIAIFGLCCAILGLSIFIGSIL